MQFTYINNLPVPCTVRKFASRYALADFNNRGNLIPLTISEKHGVVTAVYIKQSLITSPWQKLKHAVFGRNLLATLQLKDL